MTLTLWIVFALGVWVVGLATLYACAAMVKDVDRAQQSVLAQGRRARFSTPRPRRSHVV